MEQGCTCLNGQPQMKKERIILGLLIAVAGCNGGGNGRSELGEVTGVKSAHMDKPAAEGAKDEKPKVRAWNSSFGTATISGVVKFAGKPPKRRPIDMSHDKACACLHSEHVLSASIIVNENGTLNNVFVWVKKGLEGWDFPTPNMPVVLDQRGCMFYPHVQGVQTGQDILIRNSDPCTHNVHALPTSNTGFNFTQTRKGIEDIRQFHKPDVMVKIKCDIHGWMSTYLGVVDHPFFATTGEDGEFKLPKLPPDEYTIEAWHEEFGTQTETVTLGEGEVKVLEFTFEDE